MDRKILVAFGTLFGITTLAAAFSIVWFGPRGRLANVPGDFGMDGASVWILLATPVQIAAGGLLSALVLEWHIRNWPQVNRLSPDARRGLDRYRKALRCFLIGLGVLVAAMQTLAILRTADVALPVDLDIRLFYFGVGALLACLGNVAPKIPPVPDSWYTGAGFAKFNRFSGWVFAIGGFAISATAILIPTEELRSVGQILMYAIVGLPMVYILLQAVASRRTA
jgi:hypothetical protein